MHVVDEGESDEDIGDREVEGSINKPNNSFILEKQQCTKMTDDSMYRSDTIQANLLAELFQPMQQ